VRSALCGADRTAHHCAGGLEAYAVAMRSGVHPVQSEALGWLVHLANDLTTSQPPCNRSPRWTIHHVCFVLIFTRG